MRKSKVGISGKDATPFSMRLSESIILATLNTREADYEKNFIAV